MTDSAKALGDRMALGKSLVRACHVGNEARTADFIARGAWLAPLPVKFKKSSPLAVAVRRGHLGCARLVIQSGAELDAPDFQGRTPVWWAVRHARPEGLAFLLEAGADPKTATTLDAMRQGSASLECARLLLEAGAPVDPAQDPDRAALGEAAFDGRADFIRLFLKHGANPDTKDSYGMTAAHFAIANEYMEMLFDLAAAGANLRLRDHDGRSVLGMAREHEDGSLAAKLLGIQSSQRERKALLKSTGRTPAAERPSKSTSL